MANIGGIFRNAKRGRCAFQSTFFKKFIKFNNIFSFYLFLKGQATSSQNMPLAIKVEITDSSLTCFIPI